MTVNPEGKLKKYSPQLVRLAPLGVVLFFAFANSAVATILEITRPYPEDFIYAFLAGCQLGEISLIGIWLGLGIGSVYKRTILASATTILLVLTFMLTLQRLEINLPFEAAMLFIAGSIVSLLIFQIPLSIFRRFSDRRIFHPDLVLQGHETTQQFSVKHLLQFTTLVAVLIALGQIAIPTHTERALPWSEIVLFCLTFILLCAFAVLACVFVIFDSQLRLPTVALLGSTVFVVGPAFVYLLFLFIFGNYANTGDWLIPTLSFTLGDVITVSVVLSIFKLAGYRFDLVN